MNTQSTKKTGFLKKVNIRVNQLNDEYLNITNRSKIPKIFKKKYSLAIIGLLGIVIIFLLSTGSSIDSSIPTYTIKKDVFSISITESGEIKAKKSIAISA